MCSPQLRSPLAPNAVTPINSFAGTGDVAPSAAVPWRAGIGVGCCVAWAEERDSGSFARDGCAVHRANTHAETRKCRGHAAGTCRALSSCTPRRVVQTSGRPAACAPESVCEFGTRHAMHCPVVPASRSVGDIGQTGAAFRDPSGGWVAYLGRDDALAAAKAEYPKLKGIDDVRDALRHFYWVYGMTNVVGAKRALALANSHEAQYPLKTQADVRSRQMDTHNNAVAAMMATDPRWAGMSTTEVARLAIRSGCLDIVKK
jgi:hypothetical protein